MTINAYMNIFQSAIVKRAGIIIKSDTYEQAKAYEIYRICKLNIETPSIFTYKRSDFIALGLSDDEADMLILDTSKIQDYLNSGVYADGLLFELLMYNMKKRVIDEYIEMNPYVRTLIGLPLYDKWLEIEKGTITGYSLLDIIGDSVYIYGLSDPSTKLYNLTDLDIEILKLRGYWGALMLKFESESWVQYLDRGLDSFKVREADEYSLLYVDRSTDASIAAVFEDNYNKVLNYYKSVMHNGFYQDYLSNYTSSMVVYLLMSALSLTVIDVANENFVIDFKDTDLIMAILNSAGLPYIDLPPLYLEPFIYNLEKMNREKGSKQSLIDLQGIFNLNTIYKYLIYKKPAADIRDTTLSNNDKYDLYFVKVPIGIQDVEPYLANQANHIRYADMVLDDPYWGTSSDKLFSSIMEIDFNYYETKYISIENMFEFTKNMYDFTTIFKYIHNNKELTDSFKIKHGKGSFFTFSLFEGFTFIPALLLKLKGWNDVIPETIEGVNYVMGIDTDINYNKYRDIFKMFLSKPEYATILNKFYRVDGATNVNQFIDIFCKNKEALRLLQQAMIDCDEYDSFKVLKEIHDSITIVHAVKDMYVDKEGNPITSYVAYIKEYNDDLYNLWLRLEDKTEIQEELSYIIKLMEAYMNEEADPKVSSEMDALLSLAGEYGVSTFEQLKTILKYYKYLTIELKDYSLIFKVDNLLNANRTFTEFRAQVTQNFKDENKTDLAIVNYRSETIKTRHNTTEMSIVCIDDDGVSMF